MILLCEHRFCGSFLHQHGTLKLIISRRLVALCLEACWFVFAAFLTLNSGSVTNLFADLLVWLGTGGVLSLSRLPIRIVSAFTYQSRWPSKVLSLSASTNRFLASATDYQFLLHNEYIFLSRSNYSIFLILRWFQTDGSVPNTLVIANCEVVKPRVAAAEHISQVIHCSLVFHYNFSLLVQNSVIFEMHVNI